jgi:two-component system, cell cycle response regulator DivK
VESVNGVAGSLTLFSLRRCVLAEQQMQRTAAVKTILVVEDNERHMKVMCDLLTEHGYSVLGARDGTEALALARQHRPDLVLMDIMLPEVSGLEVAQWIWAEPTLKTIPIVAVSAFDLKADDWRRLQDVGIREHLAKPIRPQIVLETVERF